LTPTIEQEQKLTPVEPITGYRPQLDSLRAFAIMLTMVVHFVPDAKSFSHPIYWQSGVRLFYVLSGLLITGILLRNRWTSHGLNLHCDPAVIRKIAADTRK
jgi:peptidoglycan/LPS O-acetylase OafA/YrhL